MASINIKPKCPECGDDLGSRIEGTIRDGIISIWVDECENCVNYIKTEAHNEGYEQRKQEESQS